MLGDLFLVFEVVFVDVEDLIYIIGRVFMLLCKCWGECDLYFFIVFENIMVLVIVVCIVVNIFCF